jgi:hypothetical protein
VGRPLGLFVQLLCLGIHVQTPVHCDISTVLLERFLLTSSLQGRCLADRRSSAACHQGRPAQGDCVTALTVEVIVYLLLWDNAVAGETPSRGKAAGRTLVFYYKQIPFYPARLKPTCQISAFTCRVRCGNTTTGSGDKTACDVVGTGWVLGRGCAPVPLSQPWQ